MPDAPSKVAVVTDSTAYLPPDLVDRYRLTVVPLQVVVGGRSLAEGVEVSSEEVAAALREWRPVTTSRPAPQTFVDAYRRLGVPEIVSVHLSADLSGTVDAARLAARQVEEDGITVVVVDSRSLGMGLGLTARAAAQAAEQGADAEGAARIARRYAHEVAIYLYVDTLEYLRRGGRVGAAAAMVGSALAVKPLLHLADGRLEPVERVRTASRALARLEELAVRAAGARPVDVAVQHLAAAERAQEVADRLSRRLPELRTVMIGEVGAVVGAHVGPGMLGVVVAPAA
ncbi:MAG TPA: DegV family protein [Kineosporiaceae bacterium]|nr:DegV family protein [Kineosporiaceae bacterium]